MLPRISYSELALDRPKGQFEEIWSRVSWGIRGLAVPGVLQTIEPLRDEQNFGEQSLRCQSPQHPWTQAATSIPFPDQL